MSTPSAAPDPLFIKDLIRRVHAELYASRAEREAAEQDPLFQLDSLVLEVNFVVTNSANVKGGLDFKIITAGGEKDYEQQQVHKVTLSMSAVPLRAGSTAAGGHDDGLIPLEDDGKVTFRPRLD